MPSPVFANCCALSLWMLSERCLVMVTPVIFVPLISAIFEQEARWNTATCLTGWALPFHPNAPYLTTCGKNSANLQNAMQQWTWSCAVFSKHENVKAGFRSKTGNFFNRYVLCRVTCSCSASCTSGKPGPQPWGEQPGNFSSPKFSKQCESANKFV